MVYNTVHQSTRDIQHKNRGQSSSEGLAAIRSTSLGALQPLPPLLRDGQDSRTTESSGPKRPYASAMTLGSLRRHGLHTCCQMLVACVRLLSSVRVAVAPREEGTVPLGTTRVAYVPCGPVSTARSKRPCCAAPARCPGSSAPLWVAPLAQPLEPR